MIALLAAGAFAMDLDEARALAEARAFEVVQAQADAEEARARVGLAWSGTLPSVVGFADYTIGAGQTAFGFERPILDQFAIGVQGSWRLVDPSVWAAAGAATHNKRGFDALLDWARLTARTDATTAYAGALAAGEVVEAWQRSFDDAERQEDAVVSLAEAGLRPRADAARATAARAAARAGLVTAEGEQQARCAELQGLLRVEVTGQCDLAPVEWASPEPSAGEHPVLTASREALAAARATRTSAYLDYAPTVDVVGSAGEYYANDTRGPGWSAGVGVDLPLVVGGSRAASLRVARAQADEAEHGLDQTVHDLEVLRISAEARLRSATASVASLEESVASADEALRLVDERYSNGLEGITEWLEARRQRDTAAIALARGRASLGQAVAALEAAQGGR